MADKLRIVNRALQRIGAKKLESLTENTRERISIDAAYQDIVEQELMTNFWTFAIKRAEIPEDNEEHAESAEIATAGTGYVVDELITLVGGTGQAAVFRVDEIGPGGAVASVSVSETPGFYTENPTNPVSTTSNLAGTGCTLTVTYEATPIFGRAFSYTKPTDYLRSAPFDPSELQFIKSCLFEGNKILAHDAGPLQLRYVSDLTVLPPNFTEMEDLFDPLFANAVSMRLAVEIAEELVGSSAKLDRVESAYTFFVNKARQVNAIEAGPIEPEVDEFVAVRIQHEVDPTIRSYNN